MMKTVFTILEDQIKKKVEMPASLVMNQSWSKIRIENANYKWLFPDQWSLSLWAPETGPTIF